jgi:hypothetical protein
MFWILAIMMVSCNDALEVEITPDNNPSHLIYNSAECTYYGDILGNSVAFFELNIYNSANSNIGLLLMGFCALPTGFANFTLDAGTYNLSSNGAVRSFLPGMFENETFIGTCLYNKTTGKITFITNGVMTVSLSGNTYTIKCTVAGKDAITNVTEKDVQIRFTGNVNFTDHASSTIAYTGTGKPEWLSNPGAATWTGIFETVEKDMDKWYKITNWGNDDITVYCDEVDQKIRIDNYTRVAYNDTYDGFFRVGYIDGTYLNILPSDDYVIKYYPYSKVLDFTGTVTDAGKQYKALIGVAAYHKTTGNLGSVFSDFYADVKLKLTPIPATPRSFRQPSNSLTDMLIDTRSTQWKPKPEVAANPTTIAIDELDKSLIERIPLRELKMIENSTLHSH